MRCSYFKLEHYLRVILKAHYYAMNNAKSPGATTARQSQKERLETQIPSEFCHRLESLVSKHIAQALWGSTKKYNIGSESLRELHVVRSSLQTEQWEIYIPQYIQREPHFFSDGDASQNAGGAVSQSLGYWFRVMWSPGIRGGATHINCLEFVVAFLQVVAAVVRCDKDGVPPFLRDNFPDGFPVFPVLLNVSEVSLDDKARLFPSQSRTVLTKAGPSRPPKEARTIRSHRIHYYRFVFDMNMTDDLLLQHVPHERRVLQVAMYATHLALGYNLHGKQLKSDTIKSYICHVSTFLMRFGGHDPRYDNVGDTKMSRYLTSILDEVSRHEGVCHKCEPYTLRLQQELEARILRDAIDRDSLLAALADWFVCHLMTGYWLSKWAQTSAGIEFGQHARD
ncbi:unnamed protein product [Cylindrotheca closterium]|uniref:Uncharacterized protein n=1 Tax=Cylindrotheca closterium TaxID=2856 RepID=A0AAD2CSJ9_9STRA|nr:unnamed protein product [Cylindrotheca closterium]